MRETRLDVTFKGSKGGDLAARLHIPQGPIRAFALFAHCFTCTKDILAARRIADELALRNIALMRFDFGGIGQSDGAFEDSDFSSNVGDILAAASYLKENYQAPQIIIGHSLGGAAILAAAEFVDEARAVVTIGAPANADHVIHNFGKDLEAIERDGQAEVLLAGRPFTIRQSFVDDLKAQSVLESVKRFNKPLMVMHAPLDETVGIDEARQIFQAAKHPKSFVSLDDADHLLTRAKDCAYAAEVIAGWSSRYLSEPKAEDADEKEKAPDDVTVAETGKGGFQNRVTLRHHSLMADEPVSMGGLDSGFAPYDLLAASLGACTSMTLRMYADMKKLPLERVSVVVTHAAEGKFSDKRDIFNRMITVTGDLSDEMCKKLHEIADKCPVHRTLHSEKVTINTELEKA